MAYTDLSPCSSFVLETHHEGVDKKGRRYDPLSNTDGEKCIVEALQARGVG